MQIKCNCICLHKYNDDDMEGYHQTGKEKQPQHFLSYLLETTRSAVHEKEAEMHCRKRQENTVVQCLMYDPSSDQYIAADHQTAYKATFSMIKMHH